MTAPVSNLVAEERDPARSVGDAAIPHSESGATRGIRLVLAGAAPDTGNLGVTALSDAMIEGLLSRLPECELTVFDFGTGLRRVEENGVGSYWLCGAKHSRRFHKPETMWNIRMAAKLGGLNNPAAKRLLAADAVLDISGGDSFSDIYGPRRFRAVALTKVLAQSHGVPLILLPQTYGPFQSDAIRRSAQDIVGTSEMAWARDEHSFAALRSLLGTRFDAERHRSGVDVAFLLRVRQPRTPIDGVLAGWLRDRAGRELVGINVSGLLYNKADEAKVQYGLKATYAEVVTELTRRMLEKTNALVMLMPHVVTPHGHYESDVDACESVKAALGELGKERVQVAPALERPGEAKWLISQTDWFCGTRMHATIAGLSSGVATAAIAYSPKTLGVFESCGQGEHVADPRSLGTNEVVDRLWKSWESRRGAKASIAAALPTTIARAKDQMDRIAELCVKLSAARSQGRSRR